MKIQQRNSLHLPYLFTTIILFAVSTAAAQVEPKVSPFEKEFSAAPQEASQADPKTPAPEPAKPEPTQLEVDAATSTANKIENNPEAKSEIKAETTTEKTTEKTAEKTTESKAEEKARADEKPKSGKKSKVEDKRFFRFGPSVGTDFPFWLGADLRLMFFDRLMLSAGVGSTPTAYSSLIGQTAASVGGNSAYKPVVEALYQSNSLFRIGLEYRFRGPTGWGLGLNYYRQTTNGEAKLADIAQATNQNFQSLLALLNALGKSSVIRGETTMTMAQLQGSYTWSVLGCLLRGSVGVIKFTDATLKLSSQSSIFDSSSTGQATYAEAEKSLKATLVNYGISPTAGLDLIYLF